MTEVVNIKTDKYDVYIWRAGYGLNGYFGNQHPVYIEWKSWTFCKICHCKHNRDQAIKAFEKDFLIRVEQDLEFRENVLKLRNKKTWLFLLPIVLSWEHYQKLA